MTEPTDAHRGVYDLLVNKHPHGLTRDDLATHSGLGDRTMRRVLEELRIIAAEKPHPQHGPIVLGYDPVLGVYTFGKSREQRERMYHYHRERVFPILAALKAQAAAIEYHDKASDPGLQDALFQAQKALDTRPWS